MGNKVYLIAFHPLPDEECVNIYGFDISDQKELERKLQESKEDLAEVHKTAHIGNWKWNIVTNELSWSDEVYRIFGLNPQEFEATFDAYFNYVHPDDRNIVVNAIKKNFEGESYSIDNRIITANGEERIVHSDAEFTFNEDNIPVYARGIVQDITERKKAKEALQESEERFRSVFDDSAVAMALVGQDARLLRVNDVFCQMLGFEKSEIEGHTFLYFTYPDDMKPSILAHKAAINSEKPFLWIEKRYIRKDGRVIWCDVSSSPVLDPKGCPIYTVAHIQDITERKKAEEALRESEAKYRDLFETVQEVFYIDRLIYDEQGNVVDWIFEDLNPAGFELLGLKDIDEAKGKRGSEVLGLEVASFYLPMIEKARRSSKAVTFQYHSPYVDKEFLTSYIVRGDRLISTQMDATERK